MTRMRKAGAVALSVTALSLGQQPASAAPEFAVDHFKVCYSTQHCGDEYTEGKITWGQRTARVEAAVIDRSPLYVTVHFHAFAGSTMVDHKTISGSETFTIGDPNRRGGIDRIRTQVCVSGSQAGEVDCGRQWNDIRD